MPVLRLAAVLSLLCLGWLSSVALDRGGMRRSEPAPSFECPKAPRRLPEGAATAIALHLGAEAQPLCLGDLNGNGLVEALAVVSDGAWGEGMGHYWATRKSGIFEAERDQKRPWKTLLLTSDRIENERGVIGWKEPIAADAGIGLRFTMTADNEGICLQLRRLDFNRHRSEPSLVLVRWDRSVARYEPGSCPGGTRGKVKR